MNKMHFLISALVFLHAVLTVRTAVTSGSIHSLQLAGADNKNESLSLTVQGDGSVTVEEARDDEPLQRFIARITTGNIFNLFLEVQPWNWVDYIVEKSKTVSITDKTPQVLDAVLQDGVRVLIQNNYDGNDGQKWYLVPSSQDENTGLITNLLSRRCIASRGEGEQLTAEICNNNDPNQLWRIVSWDEGRCY